MSANTVTVHAARYGIDFRHPLLDHRLYEFAASVPSHQTHRAEEAKRIVRNALRGYGPDAVLDLPGQHFDGLFDRGVRERERDKVWTLLTDMRAAALGIVEERPLREAYQSYLDGKSRARFWYTATLEDWLRRHFP
jgi:asparagine synthase (glutamine-hydrolysing)